MRRSTSRNHVLEAGPCSASGARSRACRARSGIAQDATLWCASQAQRNGANQHGIQFRGYHTFCRWPNRRRWALLCPSLRRFCPPLILKEQVGKHRWGAVLAGFAGVLIVVQPGGSHIPPLGALVSLTSAIMISLTSLQIRDMGRTEAAITTVFWFSALSVLPMEVCCSLFS